MSNKLLWLFIKQMHFFLRFRLSVISRLISFFIRIVFSAQIPPETSIGKNTVFGYGGLAVVLHKDAVIGENCRIGAGVTLGSRVPDIRAPIVGNNCFIAAGAKILGGVKIGDDCVVGANAVVTKDIPEKSVAVGIPAIVVKTNIDIREYNESFFE